MHDGCSGFEASRTVKLASGVRIQGKTFPTFRIKACLSPCQLNMHKCVSGSEKGMRLV